MLLERKGTAMSSVQSRYVLSSVGSDVMYILLEQSFGLLVLKGTFCECV